MWSNRSIEKGKYEKEGTGKDGVRKIQADKRCRIKKAR
jgi:hypothetical protein